jgi:RNA-directed DNA polymerase
MSGATALSQTNLWEEVCSFDALCRASRRAARGKKRVRAAAKWLADLEPACLRLESRLRDGSWRPGKPTTFVIHDPKTRTITAAPFGDRVVHHALMDALEPHFEALMLPHSFACRKGKGTHAALSRARELVRAHDWFLKLDVASFFDSLEHDVVLDTLDRVVCEPRAMSLARTIVCARGQPGRGLPIGNLTSQWLANLVLDRLDQFVTAEIGAAGYIRYMDDFVLFGETKNELRAALQQVRTFLRDHLYLELKARATTLAPAHQGLPFLGWRIYRGTTRLRPGNKKRLHARVRARQRQYRRGTLDEHRYLASVRSAFEHLRLGDTLSLRRRWLEEFAGTYP